MRASRGKRWWAGAAIVALCAACIQWRSGAYSADLSSHPDESAHAVSGLMVHDYLARLIRPGKPALPASPRAFAEAYYVHYPKVAIGHWPPLFYAVQAGWMFIFGRTKAALLLLMLIAVALTAILLMDQARRAAGNVWTALAAVAIFLLLPVTQQSLSSVMPDAMLALLACAGVSIAGSHRSHAWLWATAFAAVLIHARGAPIFVLPFLALLGDRQENILKKRSLWIAAVAALLLVAPWLLFVKQTESISARHSIAAVVMFPVGAMSALGVVPFLLIVCGAFVVPYRKEASWYGITGIVVGTWLFFSIAIVPWENRYLIVAVPASIQLMAGAWRWLGQRLAPAIRLPSGALTAVLAAGTALACLHWPLVLPKPDAGFEAVAKRVMALPGTVYLVAGTTSAEGAFIAAVDLAEHPGRHIVLRSSKMLARSDWSAFHYRLLFSGPRDVAAYLASSPISVVIVEDPPAAGVSRPDVEMLREALRQTPSWVELPAAPHVRIYQRTEPLPPGPVIIRLDMRYELHKYLEWSQ